MTDQFDPADLEDAKRVAMEQAQNADKAPVVSSAIDVAVIRTIADVLDAVEGLLNKSELSPSKAREYLRFTGRLEPSDVDLELLIEKLSSKNAGLALSAKAMRKEYKKARADFVREQVTGGKCDPDIWLEWCKAQFRIIRNYGGKPAVIPKNRSSDGTVMPPMSKRAFEESSLERRVYVGVEDNGEPIFKAVHPWYLIHESADRYDTQVFKPVHQDEPGEYNVWRGWPWERPESEWQYEADETTGWLRVSGRIEDGSILWPRIYDYLSNVLCSGNVEHFRYVIRWLAHWVQNPLEYNTTVIGVRGDTGTGKTKLLELVKSLIGADYSTIFTNPDVLRKDFNAQMLYKMFLGFDEAFAVSDKKAEAIFKNLVTGEVFTVEKKFLDAFEARKFFRMIFASNEEWFMSADFGDRRQFLLTCSTIHRKDGPYFAALDKALGIDPNGTPEMWAFFEFLQRMPLSGFDLRDIPQTATLMEQQIRSLRGDNRILYSILEAGILPLGVSERIAAQSFDASLPDDLWVEAHFIDTQVFTEMLQHSGYDHRMDTYKAGCLLSMISAGGEYAESKQPLTKTGYISRDQKWDAGSKRNLTGRWIGPPWLSKELAARHFKAPSVVKWKNENENWSPYRNT